MTSSRSRASTSSRVAILAALVMLWWAGAAEAGRKRLVVLDFDGPKAERFHDDIVKILKKSNTVVPADKWTSTADDLSAAKLTEKNIKKVAKKLKIDGVIEGTVEKRRDQYIVRLKLHEGKTGTLIGKGVEAKADGPHLDGDAAKDIKDELSDQIDALASNKGGGLGGDDDDDDSSKPKHVAKGDDDDDSSKPKHVAKGDDDDDDKGPKKGFGKKGPKTGADAVKGDDDDDSKPKHVAKGDDDDDSSRHKQPKGDDDDDAPRHHKKPHKHASGDDDDGSNSVRASSGDDDDSGPAAFDPATLTPAERAIEAAIGFSLTDRKLSFESDADLATPPSGYKGVPVAGAAIDVTVYPLAWGHTRHDILKNFGLNLLIDRVIKISTQTSFMDSGMTQNATLATEEQRVQAGLVFRYPLGTGANPIVVGGMLRYGKQQFIISHQLDGQALPVGAVDVPNVHYSMYELGPFARIPLGSSVTLLAKATALLVTDAGTITTDSEYGGGKVTAFEVEGGIDYALSNALFIRATARLEQFRLSFNGTGDMTTDRDTDPDQDVHGAHDTYFGGTLLIGFLY